MISQHQSGALPIPLCLEITDAGTADIKVLDESETVLPAGFKLFADKAYQRDKQPIVNKGLFILYTPFKKEKDQGSLDAADRLLSKTVSKVRQPIEALFNWIEQKTKLQVASKVRFFEGFMVYIFSKIAGALFILNQKFCS